MPDPVLCIAIYIIWWWMAFFAVLPIGVRSQEEAGAAPIAGNDSGAPAAPRIRTKMAWAALAAALLWAATIAVIVTDPFNVRPDLGR
jgi:predicted secreted protein